MNRLLIATVAGGLSALAFAGPPSAQADDASFFDYLDSHGYNYSNPFGSRDQALATGRAACQYPELSRSTPNYNPQAGLIQEAAKRELCPEPLQEQADAKAFFAYLDSRGYNYSNPFGNREQALGTGRAACEYADRARSAPSYNPQYGLILEAAGHELCPDRLGAGS